MAGRRVQGRVFVGVVGVVGYLSDDRVQDVDQGHDQFLFVLVFEVGQGEDCFKDLENRK